MKKNILLMAMIIGVMVVGCAKMREESAEELLENSRMKEEIYSVILADESHLSEFISKFIDKAMTDENCKAIVTGNHAMVKMMYMSGSMDSMMNTDRDVMEIMTNRMVKIMEADTAACNMMCSKVMGSKHLKKYVQEHVCPEGR